MIWIILWILAGAFGVALLVYDYSRTVSGFDVTLAVIGVWILGAAVGGLLLIIVGLVVTIITSLERRSYRNPKVLFKIPSRK